MSATSREELKEQLRAMVAGRGDGIDLDTPFHWVIENLKNPVPFFHHLPAFLPLDSVLYIEGTSIAPEIATFYVAHRAGNTVNVIRDTIAPVPDIFHVAFAAEVSDRLRQFSERHAVAEMFDHLKAYRGDVLLFTFHDAFDGWLRISGRVSEATVKQFGQMLEMSCRREETKRRDPEQLGRILEAFEHPERVKIRGAQKSWLQRIWRWLRDEAR